MKTVADVEASLMKVYEERGKEAIHGATLHISREDFRELNRYAQKEYPPGRVDRLAWGSFRLHLDMGSIVIRANDGIPEGKYELEPIMRSPVEVL